MKIAENIQKLICLAKEHPELPIIAMVDGEIVGDDSYSRWVGYFGSVELGEFVLYNDRFIDDREEFKEQFYDYNDDELCKKFGYEPCINSIRSKTDITHRSSITKTRRTERNLKHISMKWRSELSKRRLSSISISQMMLRNLRRLSNERKFVSWETEG
ncbi:MAG: hypothetical protein ACLS48_10645 [[Eubacterium] siraeum]